MPAPRKNFDSAIAMYMSGLSISQVAKVFGVSRQAMWDALSRRGVEMRQPNRRTVIVWQGRRFTLRDNGYYGETSGKRELLHRAMWIEAFGPIPDGYQIHHRDGDKENNTIENFELLTASEHTKEHGFRGNQHTKRKSVSALA